MVFFSLMLFIRSERNRNRWVIGEGREALYLVPIVKQDKEICGVTKGSRSKRVNF